MRRIRKDKALTHERLAELAGLHHTFISLLERGQRQPSLNTVFFLAAALDVAPHEMVSEIERLKARPKR